MPTKTDISQKLKRPTIISHIKDLPNILSLLGLACTLIAIYCSILGIYSIAMIGMVWAVAFDWADGLVARRIKNRTTTDSKYGGELDILIDIVSYGVAPAILLLSYGKFDSIFLIGAIFLVSTAAIRLSYFSTYGLINGKKYTGLALDNNSLILVSIFLLEGSIGSEIFTIILYFSMITLGILNISEIKMSKLSGNTRNVWLLAIYTLIITAIYGWKFLN